ncbi:MAG: CbtB-domain containing protein [Rhizobiaceae bacterium]|nr:CbtB-domain containing protein [Rhizobiaceae bacterium]
MNANTTIVGASASRQSRLVSLSAAALLGMFVIGFVGFSHVEAAHNAGHDYRHSMAFPCH